MECSSYFHLSLGEVVQIISVPFTAWVTYRIYKLGEAAEGRRQLTSLGVDYSNRCRELGDDVCRESVRYYTTRLPKAERTQIAATTRLEMKRLSQTLGQLAEICGKEKSFFAPEYGEFLSATTGGDFGSTTVNQRAIEDNVILAVHQTREKLYTKVHDCLLYQFSKKP